MLQVMIENRGEAPIESFTMLGLSTARGVDNLIGQFGTGANNAVLVLLREGIPVTIYSGRRKLEFFTRPKRMEHKTYNQVCVKIGTKVSELSVCDEFGELDWTDPAMAMREFVSNAIDAAGMDGTNITVTDKTPRAKAGYTRVFVGHTAAIGQFVCNLDNWFLQFRGVSGKRLIDKTEEGSARIYRKGVFVRQLSGYRKPSLFDYNFGDELRIDESRNLEDWAVMDATAKLVSEEPIAAKTILKALIEGKQVFELSLSKYSLKAGEVWANAWQSLYGNTKIATNSIQAEYMNRKGFKCVVIENEAYFSILESSGIETADAGLDELEKAGCTKLPASEVTQATLDRIWQALNELGLTNGKTKPPVQNFVQVMDGGSQLMGKYENGVVYINKDHESDMTTMLEEVAHYVTGATDNSRDFQDYAFKAAALAISFLA